MRGSRPRVAAWRRRLLLVGWLSVALIVVGRAAELQLLDASEWREVALGQHQTSARVAAARGTILDRDGVVLAVSRETYQVSVAPRESRDRAEAEARLQRVLGLTAREARRLTDPSDVWRVVPGRWEPSVREALSGVRGIYLQRELRRHYPHGDAAAGILGRVVDGRGLGGIEEQYEDLLHGTPGRQVLARDHVGRPIPGEAFVVEDPRPGGEVRLTLDLDLQEIAEQALSEAVEKTEARGGDILVTDPLTGEILAMVSIKGSRTDALAMINEPYEPGSTLKPFTVSTILAHGVGRLGDEIDTEGGTWRVGGHLLRDISDHGVVSLAEGLRVSSNVAIAKAAESLTPAMQYEGLRDFGFGSPTGIPLPGEVAGTLRPPASWSGRSFASLAIGYELAVTPLQMALAYGALANGGLLMEPRLIVEAREGSGRVVESLAPRVTRRVVPSFVSHALSRVLVGAVEDGTGGAARLSTFSVAGKSGTSRAYVPGVGYTRGRYFASFAGFFPADDPQLVIFVKLDSPEGAYYGGATAAPVTRATMEAVLAARKAPIDRGALLKVVRTDPFPSPGSSGLARPAGAAGLSAPLAPAGAGVGFASMALDPGSPTGGMPSDEAARGGGALFDGPVDGRPAALERHENAVSGVPMPDVRGMPVRSAARKLHGLGFRVLWEGSGETIVDAPEPGARLPRGDTVRIVSGRTGR